MSVDERSLKITHRVIPRSSNALKNIAVPFGCVLQHSSLDDCIVVEVGKNPKEYCICHNCGVFFIPEHVEGSSLTVKCPFCSVYSVLSIRSVLSGVPGRHSVKYVWQNDNPARFEGSLICLVIDVTSSSASRRLDAVLKQISQGLLHSSNEHCAGVVVISYDASVHLWRCCDEHGKPLKKPQMLSCLDPRDSPISVEEITHYSWKLYDSEFIVSWAAFVELLPKIHSLQSERESTRNPSAMGAALIVAEKITSFFNGNTHIVAVVGSLPTAPPGEITEKRGEKCEKDGCILAPSSMFYRDLGFRLSKREHQCVVDSFALCDPQSSQSVFGDLVCIAEVSRLTGGIALLVRGSICHRDLRLVFPEGLQTSARVSVHFNNEEYCVGRFLCSDSVQRYSSDTSFAFTIQRNKHTHKSSASRLIVQTTVDEQSVDARFWSTTVDCCESLFVSGFEWGKIYEGLDVDCIALLMTRMVASDVLQATSLVDAQSFAYRTLTDCIATYIEHQKDITGCVPQSLTLPDRLQPLIKRVWLILHCDLLADGVPADIRVESQLRMLRRVSYSGSEDHDLIDAQFILSLTEAVFKQFTVK